MGDVFKEQIVKRVPTAKDTAIKVCLWVLAVVLGFAAFLSIEHFGILIFIAAIFGARFLMSFLNVEYEYIFTNGELDIDIIYDRARRKRVFTAVVKDFEIMAPADDKTHEAALNAAEITNDFSSGVPGNNTYAFVTMHNNKKTRVIIEPNEKMLKAFSGVLTRRNLHLRPGVVLGK